MMQNLPGIILSIFLLLGACTSTLRPVEHQPQGFQSWNDELPAYRFMPGDELDITLTYNPEFSGRVIVAPDGNINLALIGSVRALGRTPTELANELQRRYAVELRRPELTVIPKQFGSEIIYVGGEVQRPGVYKLAYRMSLLEGVLEAGGFLDTARKDEVVLIRRNSQNKPMLKLVNAHRIIEGKFDREGRDVGNVPLHRFDVVYVPKSSVAEVNLWIDQYINRNIPFTRNFSYTINRDSGSF